MFDPRILPFHQLHRGERVFLLASGPSLTTLPLDRLRGQVVMGLNRSALAFPETQYHCAMDRWLFRRHPSLLRRCPTLFTVPDRPFGIPLRLLDDEDERVGPDGFSLDLREGIYSGRSVAYFALQVAVWMGFQEIVYLGLDLAHGPTTHFFGNDHPRSNEKRLEIFRHIRTNLENAARLLQPRGVRLVQCGSLHPVEGFEQTAQLERK